MAVYTYELLPKLKHLTLVGIEDGELQFMGSRVQWEAAEIEEEAWSNLSCRTCGGIGTVPVFGDGCNFENEVIRHEICGKCRGRKSDE